MPETIATPAPDVQTNAPVTETKGIETAATKAAKERMFKIKSHDGKEEEKPESWILDRAQKSFGLEKRVADADRYEKAIGNIVSRMSDPSQLVDLLNHPELKYDDVKKEALLMTVLNSGNIKLKEAVKKWLWDTEAKYSVMDPKEAEALRYKEENEKLKAAEARRLEESKKAEEEQQIVQLAEVRRQQLAAAYQKSGLPMHDDLVRAVLEKARLFIRSNQAPDFDRCCALVQQDLIDKVKFVLGKAEVENILNYMDGETPQKINKALLNAVDKKETGGTKPNPSAPSKRRIENRTTATERKDLMRNWRRGIY